MNTSMKIVIASFLAVVVLCTAVMVSNDADAADPADPSSDAQYEAEVNGQQYETLKEALQSAADGETVTLLKDIEIDPNLNGDSGYAIAYATITADITVDLNGKSISWTELEPGTELAYSPVFFNIHGCDVVFEGDGIVDSEAAYTTSYCMNVTGGGSVTINGGTYYGAMTAVQVTSGKATINGGTFELASTVSAEAPDMDKYLINCIDGYFLNGQAHIEINGGTFGYDFSANPEGVGTTYIGTGFISQPTDGDSSMYEVVRNTSTDYVAESADGSVKFTSLKEALNKTSVFDIRLLKDVTLDVNGLVLIQGGRDYVLDLNGYTVSGADEQTMDGNYLLKNYGILTIQDSVGTGGFSTGQYADAPVINYGTLTINGGTFNGGLYSVNNADFSNESSGINWSGNAKITGGSFEINGSYAFYQNSEGSTEITGGTFSNTNGVAVCIYKGSMTIRDGTFEGSSYAVRNDGGGTLIPGPLEIYGGTFTGTSGAIFQYSLAGPATIQGGSFSSDVGRYVDDGYVSIENESGYFDVVEGWTVTFEMEDGTEYPVPVPLDDPVVDAESIPDLTEPSQGASYSYYWYYSGDEWDQSMTIDHDITVEQMRLYNDVSVTKDRETAPYGEQINVTIDLGTDLEPGYTTEVTWFKDGELYHQRNLLTMEFDLGGEYTAYINVKDGSEIIGTATCAVEIVFQDEPFHVTFVVDGTTYVRDYVDGQIDNIPGFPDAPDHYDYVWLDENGSDWESGDPVGSDMTLTATMYISDITAYAEVGTDSLGKTTLTIRYTTPVDVDVVEYGWSFGGSELSSDATVTPDGFGIYIGRVLVQDVNDVQGYAYFEYDFSATHTVTFEMPDGTDVVRTVDHNGTVADIPMPDIPEHYVFVWMDRDGQGFDSDTVVIEDMFCSGAFVMNDIGISIGFEFGEDGVYAVADWAPAVELSDYSVYWDIDGGVRVEGERVLMQDGYECYQFCVEGTDVNGVIAYNDWAGALKASSEEGSTEVTVPSSGGSATVVVPSRGEVSVNETVDFKDAEGSSVATVQISGTAEDPGVPSSIGLVPSEGSVVDGYVDMAPGLDAGDVRASAGVDVTVGNVTDFLMVIKIPLTIESGYHIVAAQAYFYDTTAGMPVAVTFEIVGNEVWIYTTHNTEYFAVATEVAPDGTGEDPGDVPQEPTGVPVAIDVEAACVSVEISRNGVSVGTYSDGDVVLLEPGTYQVRVYAAGYTAGYGTLTVSEGQDRVRFTMTLDAYQPPVTPTVPDDGDDYVPIPPVVYDDSGDDDTVKVVACVAAAVVAALIAAYLIIDRKH